MNYYTLQKAQTTVERAWDQLPDQTYTVNQHLIYLQTG